jgi:hypothetical protein
MRKQNKNMCFDLDILEFLDTQPNASALVQDLIYAEMKRIEDMKKKSGKQLDMNEVHQTVIMDAEALLKKEEEKAARAKAWENLDLEVREEIKDMESWGTKWKEIFYPMFASKGSLTLKEVRDWYFANKEGFKL